MLRSRRATPIQDIVDGATTEDRTDCRQDHRLRVGAAEHLGNDFTRQRRVALDRNTATYRFGPMKSKVVFIPSKTTIQYRKATAE